MDTERFCKFVPEFFDSQVVTELLIYTSRLSKVRNERLAKDWEDCISGMNEYRKSLGVSKTDDKG